MEASKRRQQDPQKPDDASVPKIGLHEMIPIFWRLPTSELVKFISNMSNHPLGKFWSGALKFVVEKRRPFSLKATFYVGYEGHNRRNSVHTNHVIYDCNGSKVADIKHPEHFHLSPLCELIEAVALPFSFPAVSCTTFVPLWHALGTLSNLKTLTLAFWKSLELKEHEIDLLEALPPEIMPQLSSLSLSGDCWLGLEAFCTFYNDLPHVIARTHNLRKLSITEIQFVALQRAVESQAADAVTAPLGILLSNLESLCITYSGKKCSDEWRELIVQFIIRRCANLSELSLPLCGEFGGRPGVLRDYFAAVRQLPTIVKLGLDAEWAGEEAYVELA